MKLKQIMITERNKIILSIILVLHSCVVCAQIETDTIDAGYGKAVISYPQKSVINKKNYEEGFFIDISCVEDTSVIVFHYGGMVERPLIKHSGQSITSQVVVEDCLIQTRGFYYLNSQKRYFREDQFIHAGVTISYDNVHSNRLAFYESLLNSFKFCPAK